MNHATEPGIKPGPFLIDCRRLPDSVVGDAGGLAFSAKLRPAGAPSVQLSARRSRKFCAASRSLSRNKFMLPGVDTASLDDGAEFEQTCAGARSSALRVSSRHPWIIFARRAAWAAHLLARTQSR